MTRIEKEKKILCQFLGDTTGDALEWPEVERVTTGLLWQRDSDGYDGELRVYLTGNRACAMRVSARSLINTINPDSLVEQLKYEYQNALQLKPVP